MFKQNYSRNRQQMKRFFILVFAAIFLIYGILFTEKVLKPNMLSVAEIRAKAQLTQIINTTVRERLLEDMSSAELLDVIMDANGKVSMVQADTAAMNYLSAQLIAGAQEQMRSADAQTLEVPLGSLLGGQILSQTGPNIVLKVKPIGSVKMDFETTFEQMGINQVRYQVSLLVESDARLLVPFSGEKISVSYRLPISETVIVGDVPDTYVFVPENEILDAI
ncbi:MAG: sporulation protein YunB [Clostridiales bacterium]|nr:sporulation protein YunB [Clostridiales bacterium]